MPLGFGLFSYVIVVIWFGFNWFVLRPKIIKKNREKTDNLIRQVEKVKLGLKDVSGSEI